MSDPASEFHSATFQQTIAELKARHSFVRADRPLTNGRAERVQQTILEECWKPAFARYLIPKQTGLRLDLERYLRYYNTERAHTGPLDPRPHPRPGPRKDPSCGGSTDALPQLRDGTP
jgi:transposase InsO family protein